jgi:stage II sporulation protein D
MWKRPSRGPVRRSVKWPTSGLVLLLAAACAPGLERPVGLDPALPTTEPDLRVGLVVDTAEVVVGSTAGFRATSATERNEIGTGRADQEWTARLDGNRIVLERAGVRMQGEAGAPVVLQPRAGGRLIVGERPYRGTVLLQATANGRVTAVNLVDMEGYLLGVVPREIGRVGEDLLEAAKAQAIAARTYAIAHLGRREALGFDVYATVQDQVYGGVADEHEPVSRAVRETRGEIVVYDGRPIEAYYHSTCAGQTAAIEEVWDDSPRPYLRSVVDVNSETGEAYDHFSNRFRWTQRWSGEELERVLSTTLADSLPPGRTTVGAVRNMEILERTHSDRIARLRIDTDAGTFMTGRDRVRWILRTPESAILNSSKFELELQRDAAGRVTEAVAHGGGWGHGIGMCQVGAMGRARHGQDYRQILTTYYTGTDIVRLYR